AAPDVLAARGPGWFVGGERAAQGPGSEITPARVAGWPQRLAGQMALSQRGQGASLCPTSCGIAATRRAPSERRRRRTSWRKCGNGTEFLLRRLELATATRRTHRMLGGAQPDPPTPRSGSQYPRPAEAEWWRGRPRDTGPHSSAPSAARSS